MTLPTVVCVCFGFLALASSANGYVVNFAAASEDKNLQDVIEDLAKGFFEERCGGANITDVIRVTTECVFEYFPKDVDEVHSTGKRTSLQNICRNVKEVNKIKSCFEGFQSLQEDCQPSVADIIKDFVNGKLVDTIIDFLCQEPPASGTPPLSGLFSPQNLVCLRALSLSSAKTCMAPSGISQCSNTDPFSTCFKNALTTLPGCGTNQVESLKTLLGGLTKATLCPRAPFLRVTGPTVIPIPRTTPRTVSRPNTYYESPSYGSSFHVDDRTVGIAVGTVGAAGAAVGLLALLQSAAAAAPVLLLAG